MKTYSLLYKSNKQLKEYIQANSIPNSSKVLVQIFVGETDKNKLENIKRSVGKLCDSMNVIGTSTAGEILNGDILDNTISIVFSVFEKSDIATTYIENSQNENLSKVDSIIKSDTKVLIVFGESLNTNCKNFLDYISKKYPDIILAGGKAGDNQKFKSTYLLDQNSIYNKGLLVASIGGKSLKAYNYYNYGWDRVGRTMEVTYAKGNRIYELDNKPIVDVYAKYLGQRVADDIPSSCNQFPLIVHRQDSYVARDCLDKYDDGSLLLGGDINIGEKVQFGCGNVDRILEGSDSMLEKILGAPVESLFVYSCIARRSFLQDHTSKEIAGLKDFGSVSGFFTYGEFYTSKNKKKNLLNETLTLLVLSETDSIKYKESKIRNKLASKEGLSKACSDRAFYAISNLASITSKELIEQKHKAQSEKNMIQSIINSVPDRIYVQDKEGRYLLANNSVFKRMNKNNLSQIVGKKDSDLLDKEAGKANELDNNKIIKTGKPIIGKLVQDRLSDDVDCRTLINKIPFKDDNQNVVGVITMSKDVTELKEKHDKLRNSKESLQEKIQLKINEIKKNKSQYEKDYKKIIDQVPMAVWMGDENENTVYANKILLDMLGYDLDEIKGWKSYSLWSEDTIDILKAHNKDRTKGKITEYEGDLLAKNGDTIPVKAKGIPISTGGTVSMIRDLREVKKLKEEKQKLENMNQMKNEFINIASHELRTPMTSIKGYLSMILDGDFGSFDEDFLNMIETLYNNSNRLIDLVNDMLDVSKLEAGKMNFNFKEINLSDFLESIYNEYKVMADDKDINFELILSSEIQNITPITDINKLKQVMVNLVGNALKFTPKGGRVSLKSNLENNKYKIQVTDTGKGISKENISKIFDKFGQVGMSMNKSSKGTGLGLPISQYIVKELGGSEIKVKSEIGKGSKFYFNLPLDPTLNKDS